MTLKFTGHARLRNRYGRVDCQPRTGLIFLSDPTYGGDLWQPQKVISRSLVGYPGMKSFTAVVTTNQWPLVSYMFC